MSSKKSKKDVDEISRETQRLVKDSHVRLPYHKPKQKTLKDFLNRQKITTEFQASITGSKKLLQKAWELIEHKEQNVEKFYNENSDENTLNSNCDGIQAENVSLNKDDDNNDFDKDEETKLSTYYDDEENSSHSKDTSNSEESLSKQSDDENSENDFELNCVENNSNLKRNKANQFIDDEADSSKLDCSSDEGKSEKSHDSVNESEDEEDVSTKKKRIVVVLSESSDEEDIKYSIVNLKNDYLIPIANEQEKNMSTQQLMDLCSGQFQTQLSNTQENSDDQEFEEDFDSDVLQNNNENSNNETELETLKLISAKDFFDDEAELSESDWSSDDEDHLLENIDTLEAEAGDKDKLDEDIVKDGLDKIYMRQLLDDDNQQVTVLQEMLLKDGDLHSDTGRKRKFQWDEIDENDAVFKKPLFSDNEDENDDVLSDDEKTAHWRKERFKRESYLSQKNNSDEEEDIIGVQTSSDVVSAVKKTHVIKYDKTTSSENLVSTVNFVQSNTVIEAKNIKADIISPNFIKNVKGSFMKHNSDKMTSNLLHINKKSITNNESAICKQNSDIKSLTTITSKVTSNPFLYLLKNAKSADKNSTSDDSLNVIKNENPSKKNSCDNVSSSQKIHQHKSKKTITSILQHLE